MLLASNQVQNMVGEDSKVNGATQKSVGFDFAKCDGYPVCINCSYRTYVVLAFVKTAVDFELARV